MQLGQLQKIEQPLLSLGFQIVAISPDEPAKLKESIQKHHLTYTLLSDAQGLAGRAFGLAYQVKAGTDRVLPVPAVYLIRTDGSIVFSYANPNYKVRLDPDILIAAAKAESTQ